MTTPRTMSVTLSRMVALEVRRARLLHDLRLVQKNRARLDTWHEKLVKDLSAIEKQLVEARDG